MAGKPKNRVDYFPHFTNSTGRTKRIIKQRFGAEGLCAWWELLEILCRTENHYFDASDEMNYNDLLYMLDLKLAQAGAFLDLLVKLGQIDGDLWNKNRVIWSQNLVDNLFQVYAKRGRKPPAKPKIDLQIIDSDLQNCKAGTEMPITGTDIPISGTNLPSKVKESKVKESNKELCESPSDIAPQENVDILSDGGVNMDTPKKKTRKVFDPSGFKNTINGKSTRYCNKFEMLWDIYPNKIGKKDAARHFNATIKTEADISNCITAMQNYKSMLEVQTWRQPQNGSTWFNNWMDWVNWENPAKAPEFDLDKWAEGE